MMRFLGNKDILQSHKIGFLSSKKCPAEIVLKSYNWAKQQRAMGSCIICGNHSQIEQDVFDILLKGKQPLILLLARGMKKRWDAKILKAIADDRLLVIAPFSDNITRVNRVNAYIRNQKILEISDEIIIGYASKNGNLEKILIGQTFKKI